MMNYLIVVFRRSGTLLRSEHTGGQAAMRRLLWFFAHRRDTTSGMLADLTSSLVLHLHSICNILELTRLNASDCLVVSLSAGELSGSVL